MEDQDEFVSINPHKSIYRKLGSSSHGFNESIAELIDNSIDARTALQKSGKEKLIIKITINDDDCIIEDNANGMSLKEAQKAITLAESEKTEDDLGKFGFGLKTSCLSIGDKFELITSKLNSNEEYRIIFDVDKFEKDSSVSFSKFPIKKKSRESEIHFTKILISKLKIRLFNKVNNLKKDIGKRYRAYLENNVDIYVNNQLCVADKINWSEGYPIEVKVFTQYGEITGIVGLMKESSQKGFYGFDLFRNKRMIRTYSKFGFSEHPTMARIAGELNLNFVPVTHEKNKFIEESSEYIAAEDALKESPVLKELIKNARKSSDEEKATDPRTLERIEQYKDYINKALGEREVKELFNPNVNKSGILKKNIKEDSVEDVSNIEVEERASPENESKQNLSIRNNRERNPRNTHIMPRKIKIKDKEFNWDHKFDHIVGGPIKYFDIDKIKGIIITTNKAYPAFSATKDPAYYVAENIIDSIAEIYCTDNNENTIEKFNEIKSLLLAKVANIELQIEESNQKNNSKLEKNETCQICGKKIRSNSVLTKYCNDCYKKQLKEQAKRYYNSEDYKQRTKELRASIKEKNKEETNRLFKEFMLELRNKKETT